MVQDKIIDTIKKLSAKAESAKGIGNVAEVVNCKGDDKFVKVVDFDDLEFRAD